MAIRIKPVATLAAKYKTNASAAGQSYKDGIANPRVDQKAAALAANENWKASTQDAIGRDAFATGVSSTDPGKWAANATAVGAPRYPGGIANGADAWAKGMTPILAAVANVDAPPRGVKGSETNFQRQRAYAMAAQAAAKK